MKNMKKSEIAKEILSYSKIILFSAAAAYFINSTLIANAQVPTGSMENTIMIGSRIVINRLSYVSASPQRGDIVAFQCPDEPAGSIPFLKRIIGLPGETIQGIDSVIYIDGTAIEEPYLGNVSYEDFGPYSIPENCYFMMGDNRGNSWDARYWTNKFVPADTIVGKAEMEYYPEIKLLN